MLVMDDVRHLDAPGNLHPEMHYPVGVRHPVDEDRRNQRLDAVHHGCPGHLGLHADLHVVHLDVRHPAGGFRRRDEERHLDVGRHLDEELDARCHRWRMGYLLHEVHERLALELACPLGVALHLDVELRMQA